MSKLQIDAKYVGEILELLRSNPTAQDLDVLIEQYTTIGYYVATSEGMAIEAEAVRKHAEAQVVLDKKNEDPKTTQAVLDAWATVQTFSLRQEENKAKTNLRKLQNLYDAIEQCINAIKHVERMAG